EKQFEFFKIKNLPPEEYKYTAYTYSYYNKARKSKRGSGRAYIVPISETKAIEFKGGGVNDSFQPGELWRSSFRHNGLLQMSDAQQEYALSQQLKNMNLPVVEHYGNQMLAPDLFTNQMITRVQSGVNPGQFIPVTLAREPITRLSHYPNWYKEVGEDEILNFSAKLIAEDVTHGALNIENLGITANKKIKILDLGHISNNPSLQSGIYRCRICAGPHGSSADHTLYGTLDFFFPEDPSIAHNMMKMRGTRGIDYRSFSFKMEDEQISKLGDKIISNYFSDSRKVELNLTESQIKSFRSFLNEKVLLPDNQYIRKTVIPEAPMVHGSYAARSLKGSPLRDTIYKRLINEKFSERIDGKLLDEFDEWSLNYGGGSISIKYLSQLAAAGAKNSKHNDEIINWIAKNSKGMNIDDLKTIYVKFKDTFSEEIAKLGENPSSEQIDELLSPLYRFHLPQDIIKKQLDNLYNELADSDLSKIREEVDWLTQTFYLTDNDIMSFIRNY
ncbi:hypothetical protein N9N67_09745, partial [Bacteriovoracaceae bacterium]|nr:hypothetical protein [Bacteriovoracaceae bacterium]